MTQNILISPGGRSDTYDDIQQDRINFTSKEDNKENHLNISVARESTESNDDASYQSGKYCDMIILPFFSHLNFKLWFVQECDDFSKTYSVYSRPHVNSPNIFDELKSMKLNNKKSNNNGKESTMISPRQIPRLVKHSKQNKTHR